MTEIRIVLKEALPAFRPGEVLEGYVEGEGSHSQDLHLCWTMGPSEEPELVRAVPLDACSGDGRHPFRLELPDGPWSFEGKLFSIQWRVEVGSARAEFILSPTGQALRPRD